MSDDDLALLCRSCGLCCDGSLFGRVDLEPDEIAPARRHRLHVVPSGKGFEQPCAALIDAPGGERRCSIYDERPRACRRFICRLFDRRRREGGGTIAAAIAIVQRVRALVAALEASGVGVAELEHAREHGSPDGQIARALGDYLELTRHLDESFARA